MPERAAAESAPAGPAVSDVADASARLTARRTGTLFEPVHFISYFAAAARRSFARALPGSWTLTTPGEAPPFPLPASAADPNTLIIRTSPIQLVCAIANCRIPVSDTRTSRNRTPHWMRICERKIRSRSVPRISR